ncbi:MAG: hypothetical protein IPJ93_12450 [Bacteroidota bacterium]|nr:MAG: hypothetical protein IPJ93_12450 [Bacteroidota bacterium]
MPKDKKLIIIAGPTASGKTQIAIEVAKLHSTEIVSFDSRQIFREMTIGTAVPDAQQMNTVKHHFIHSHSIAEDMNASRYADEATNTINQLLEKKMKQLFLQAAQVCICMLLSSASTLLQIPIINLEQVLKKSVLKKDWSIWLIN